LNIPANTPLEDALIRWGTATGMVVMMNTPTVDKKLTHVSINGTLSAREALARLLLDSGLSYSYTEKGQAIQVIPQGPLMPSHLENNNYTLSSSGNSDFNTADENDESANQSNGNLRRLDEIIVTGTKFGREERLQDVPIPITAISTDELTQSNQLRLQDYYTQVPSLNVSQGVQSAQNVTLRGLPSTVLVDDMPVNGAVPDIDPGILQRVEVLRGPQGTLYGASSLGGVVRYITQDPSPQSASGRLEAGLNGVHNGYDLGYTLRASGNLPITKELAVRAGAFYRQDPGYIDNPILNIQGINRDTAYGGQVVALWRPVDQFSMRVSALYQQIKGGLPDVDQYDFLTGTPLGQLQQSYVKGVGPYDRRMGAYSVVMKGEVGPVSLTSVTGYNVSHVTDYTDATMGFGQATVAAYGPSANAAVLKTVEDTSTVTQELRIAAVASQHFDILAGLYYMHTPGPLDLYLNAENATTGQTFAQYAHFGIPGPLTEQAAYLTLTYHFTDTFDLEVGGRESHIKQQFNQTVGGQYAIDIGGTDPTIAPTTYAASNPFTYLITPRLRLSNDLMIYGRFASGFVPGGANAPGQPGQDIPPEWGPEKTKNYEVGLKGDALDKLFSYDVSVYYIRFIGLVNEFYNSVTGQSYNTNAGTAKSQGVELNIAWQPLSGLKLASWVVFSDARLIEIPAGVITAPSQTVGAPLPDASRFSANFDVEKTFRLHNSLDGFIGAHVAYIGERMGPFADPRVVSPAYARSDFRAGMMYDSWTANFYVNNFTDRRGIISADLQSFIPYSRYYIMPRAVGLTVSRTF
jgi:outer membrane receptor protein involved in Fe transport